MENNFTIEKVILVTGANGQVGNEFQQLENQYTSYKFLFVTKIELSITDENAVEAFFKKNKIAVCINCAAYTAVDKAEQEKELATETNATAVGYLAKTCKANEVLFIHISTDYVFDGTATIPYQTNDKTNPVNFYGSTKLEGEIKAIKENAATIIIRTAWVYSMFGNNFVKTMMRLMKERASIGVVNDQRGAPTYAADLAVAIMKIIATVNPTPGIYHYTNTGNISWFDFAKEIAETIQTKCVVNSITTAQFPTPAARPAYSVLDTKKIEDSFQIQIADWKKSLHKCISIINQPQ